MCGPTGGARYTGTQRGTPVPSVPSLRRKSVVLMVVYRAPAHSAKPVTFCVTAPGDPGGATVSSGFGLNTKVRRLGDHTPCKIPVGRTPA